MSNINFYLRGSRVYFRYRPSKLLDMSLATPFKILPEHWDAKNQQWDMQYYTKGAKSAEKKLLNLEIESFNNNLRVFKSEISKEISTHLHLTAPEITKFIKEYVNRKYFGHKIKTNIQKGKPEKFWDLIDFYIDYRSIEDKTKGTKPLASNTIKKLKTLQKVIGNFNKNLKATEINDLFRNKFVEHLNLQNYSTNTQVKYIKDIKMICKFASTDYDVSKEVLNWKINSNIENIAEYKSFSFEQLEKITQTIMPTEYLENARDWLLISCYTSVRVSELFSFDEENIIEDGDNKFLKVIEKKNRNNKNGGLKYIYLMPQVVKIMKKRGGRFPRKISEQRYNEFIKIVCQKAGLNEIVEGGITQITNGIKRKVKVKDELWKFISSHSGRTTYVTLFSEYLPSEIIQMQTNHQSKKMVEHYNKTDLEETLFQRAKVVAQAHRDIKLKIV